MLQQSAHEIMGRPAQPRIPLLVIEQGQPVFEQQHMYVHAAARLLVDGLGEEGGGLALLGRQVLDDVFDDHGVVRHCGHVVQLHLDLHLARAAHLVVVVFHPDAPVLHHHAHVAAQVVAHVLGSRDVVAALVGHLIAIVTGGVQAVVPVRLPGVDAVAALSGSHLKTGAVEEIELELGSDHHAVGDAAFLHVFHSAEADVLWVLVEGPVPVLADGAYIAAHGQGGHRGEGIHVGGGRIRQKHHVALLDGRIAVVGAVEADAVGEGVLPEPLHRDGDVPPAAVDVRHLEVDHADLLFLAQVPDFRDFSRVLIHAANSFSSYRILYSREQ